jgi:hypothetical protein
MDKDQNNQTNQSDKNKGSDLPGTSKDPTGQVIRDKSSDKSSPGKGRQDQGSQQSGGGSREPGSDTQKRS